MLAFFSNVWALISVCVGSVTFIYGLSYLADRRAIGKAEAKPAGWALRLKPYARRTVLTLAIIWITFLFVQSAYAYANVASSMTYLTRLYGLSALLGLFVVLTPGLIKAFFPRFGWNPLLINARAALGLSVFFFMALHAFLAFTRNLDGKFTALQFLSTRHQVALVASSLALVVFIAMALTSSEKAIRWMTFTKWKRLHRLIYIATILVIFHAFLIGSHFVDIAKPLPLVVIYLALIFVLLEAAATFKLLRANKSKHSEQTMSLAYAGLITLVTAGLMVGSYSLGKTYDPHAAHRAGYSRDYNVTLTSVPAVVEPGEEAELTFAVTNRVTGQPQTKFVITQEKFMHLIVVSSDLSHFDHLHPEPLGGGRFRVRATLPKTDTYTMFAEFAPTETIEAVSAVTLATAGAQELPPDPQLVVDASRSQVDDFTVAINMPKTIQVGKDSKLRFDITRTENNKGVTDLEPYLGAFGHLAMIHEDLETYVHVHPLEVAKSPGSRGGPSVSYIATFPKAGKYKLFMQFQQGGQLRVVDFTVEAKP